jgi:anti-sigma-K factor RskA
VINRISLRRLSQRALTTGAGVARLWVWLAYWSITGVAVALVAVLIGAYGYVGFNAVDYGIANRRPAVVLVGLLPILLPLAVSAVLVSDSEQGGRR